MIQLHHTAAYQLSATNQLVIVHATCRRKWRLLKGFYYVRRWLRNPDDPVNGWEIDRWFEWRRRK